MASVRVNTKSRASRVSRLAGPGDTARPGGHASNRCVGMANGANPIAIIVPCHRVIGANGTLTGYGGGLDRKKWLLNHERGQLVLAQEETEGAEATD